MRPPLSPFAWRLAALLAVLTPLRAHMMSMSSGDIAIAGAEARYQLRMPLYELSHMKSPGKAIFESIRFSSGGRPARLAASSCRADEAAAAFLCSARYEFPAPVERLEVECAFASITVPNHVHLLRAERGGRRAQALLDLSFPRASLRFDPPSPAERAFTQAWGGFARALGGPVQLLFLASLALAARGRRELLALAAAFLAGQTASSLIVPATGWQPPPRFVEAAAALTVAYLAVEILALPKAGSRWLVAGVLGAFHGLYFALFLDTTGYNPAWVLAGAALADLLGLGLVALVFAKIGRAASALRPVQVSASLLLATGLVWFLVRVM